jgi:hypothetical protein
MNPQDRQLVRHARSPYFRSNLGGDQVRLSLHDRKLLRLRSPEAEAAFQADQVRTRAIMAAGYQKRKKNQIEEDRNHE